MSLDSESISFLASGVVLGVAWFFGPSFEEFSSNVVFGVFAFLAKVVPHLPPLAPIDIAGFTAVALADLTAIQQRTALTGGSSLADIFVLAPGLHLQQRAVDLNRGEYPACGALTSGYVFRVENPATVYYLQQVGRAGHLTTLSVEHKDVDSGKEKKHGREGAAAGRTLVAGLMYQLAVNLTLGVAIVLYKNEDWWGLATLISFVFCRACTVLIVRRRSKLDWFGQPEPGVKGDLLILLSQDRWIRLQGYVDDLKAVTSGQWFREPTMFESFVTSFVTVLTYLTTAIAGGASLCGKLLIPLVLIVNVCLISVANICTDTLYMHDRVIRTAGQPKKYTRRLDLGKELIEETGRDDWAVRMGIINAKDSKSKVDTDGGVVM